MAKLFYEHVYSAAGFSGETFDVAAGPANLGVLDVLLSVGDGALTANAPHVLTATGTLAGPAALDLAGMEKELAGDGGHDLKGRFFFLSVQTTDITTNTITLKTTTGGGTINEAATFLIPTTGDYLLHFISAGKWRINTLTRPPQENPAILVRVPFLSTDWQAHATNKNTIKCIQSGSIAAGIVGPHLITPADGYIVSVLNTSQSPHEYVDVEIQQAANGDITMKKAPSAADFSGTLIIAGAMD